MPGTMTENENLLSLLSIEVLISQVEIDLNIACHLPCIVFRLLDYPAVSIPYFDQWQVEEFHELKKCHPNVTWRQLLADQFYELRSANGKYNFKRGKSCLFKTYFKTLYTHLLNVPLFLLLIDQIHDQNTNVSHFIGSCNVKLNELIEILNQSIEKNGFDVPLVEQQTFRSTLFNLMGTKIGTCDLAIRFCHYGKTILTHLPMLDDGLVTKPEQKASAKTIIKEQVSSSSPPTTTRTDTIVKQIQLVNEKKDVGLQISRSDLPSNDNNKAAQTRWTSTKSRTTDYHQSKGRYLRVTEDPSLDDPTVAFYRPPALYFNSDSDFLQMMTPTTAKIVEETKENRLSYLASIPIASFDLENDENNTQSSVDKKEKSKLTRKISPNVRFHMPTSTTGSSQSKTMLKKPLLGQDFLHNFPLLRALVEEALALQEQPFELMPNERPQSAVQKRTKSPKQTLVRAKSAIIPRNTSKTTQRTIVTKNDVRYLVDRLSTPKNNKPIEREQTTRQPVRQPKTPVSTKSLVYRTTRAHRLMTELSRARRAGIKPPPANSQKESTSPLSKAKAASPSSLLGKVDVDTLTMEKNSFLRRSLDVIPEHADTIAVSESTTSQDVTLKLNQTLTKASSSTSTFILTEHRENESKSKDLRKDDLNFSITDITDYFTDGGESSTRPVTRQST